MTEAFDFVQKQFSENCICIVHSNNGTICKSNATKTKTGDEREEGSCSTTAITHPSSSWKAITEVSALISPLQGIQISLLFTLVSFCCGVTRVDVLLSHFSAFLILFRRNLQSFPLFVCLPPSPPLNLFYLPSLPSHSKPSSSSRGKLTLPTI